MTILYLGLGLLFLVGSIAVGKAALSVTLELVFELHKTDRRKALPGIFIVAALWPIAMIVLGIGVEFINSALSQVCS